MPPWSRRQVIPREGRPYGPACSSSTLPFFGEGLDRRLLDRRKNMGNRTLPDLESQAGMAPRSRARRRLGEELTPVCPHALRDPHVPRLGQSPVLITIPALA